MHNVYISKLANIQPHYLAKHRHWNNQNFLHVFKNSNYYNNNSITISNINLNLHSYLKQKSSKNVIFIMINSMPKKKLNILHRKSKINKEKKKQ